MAETEHDQRIIQNMIGSFFDELIKQVKIFRIDISQKIILVQVLKGAQAEFSKMTLVQLQELVPSIERMKAQIDLGELPEEFNLVRTYVSGETLNQVMQMLKMLFGQFELLIHKIEAEIELEKTLV